MADRPWTNPVHGPELREQLIAEGVLRPVDGNGLTPAPSHDLPVLRLDDAGRAAAAKSIARGRGDEGHLDRAELFAAARRAQRHGARR